MTLFALKISVDFKFVKNAPRNFHSIISRVIRWASRSQKEDDRDNFGYESNKKAILPSEIFA